MSNGLVPPRFVPTLTDVVQPATSPNPTAVLDTAAVEQLEEQMVQHVMQRVELLLERRLREAVGRLIQKHTQTLGPNLLKEMEIGVRKSVHRAVTQELLRNPPK